MDSMRIGQIQFAGPFSRVSSNTGMCLVKKKKKNLCIQLMYVLNSLHQICSYGKNPQISQNQFVLVLGRTVNIKRQGGKAVGLKGMGKFSKTAPFLLTLFHLGQDKGKEKLEKKLVNYNIKIAQYRRQKEKITLAWRKGKALN